MVSVLIFYFVLSANIYIVLLSREVANLKVCPSLGFNVALRGTTFPTQDNSIGLKVSKSFTRWRQPPEARPTVSAFVCERWAFPTT